MTDSPYLTVREVAELARCEHKAVRRAIQDGRLSAFQPAHKLLIRAEVAYAWIESRPAASGFTEHQSRRAPSRVVRRAQPGSVADLKEIEQRAVGA